MAHMNQHGLIRAQPWGRGREHTGTWEGLLKGGCQCREKQTEQGTLFKHNPANGSEKHN